MGDRLQKLKRISKQKLLGLWCRVKIGIKVCIAYKRRIILYGAVFLIAVAFIVSSLLIKQTWGNITNGIGTGLLTSLFVSMAINYENDKREKRKVEQDKKIIFNDFVNAATEIYIVIIYKINEYILFSEIQMEPAYLLYDDFKKYNKFEKSLKEINFEKTSGDERSNIELLLDFKEYNIDYFVSEFKILSKQDCYLQGLLSEEEYSRLTSKSIDDVYLDYANNKEGFWDDGIIDFDKCIKFLRMTTYICCTGISTLDFCQEKVVDKELRIKEELYQREYDEIYLQSEEYVQEQMKRQEQEEQYYIDHPEEWEKKIRDNEERENRTPEDKAIEELHLAICGFNTYTIDEIALMLDKRSPKVIQFFKQADVRRAIKKNRKVRKDIKSALGKEYLKRILKRL